MAGALTAAPVAQATGAPATASLVPKVEGNLAGLGVEVTSSTGVGAFTLTLTPQSATAMSFSAPACASGFATCTHQVSSATGAVTIAGAGGSGLAGSGEVAFVPAAVTAPVTSLVSVALSFPQLSDATGASLGSPTATAELQRGAVANATSGWPTSARVLTQGDVNAALAYMVGLEAAGLGSGAINPVNMASAVPDSASQPSTPGPADAVGILQYLSGARGSDFGLNVTATVSNVSTAGFALQLTPAVPGLTAASIDVAGASVSSVAESNAGATYAVNAALSTGTTYSGTITATGYDFSGLTIPVPGPTSVAVSVASASVTGFTLDLSQPVPGLSIGLSGATVTSFTHSPDDKTYTVAASLAPNGRYPLILSATGYSFTGTTSVSLGTQSVDFAVANQSVTGFTLDLSVPVPGLSIGLSNATVTSVTYSPDDTTYTVAASLAPNGSYPLSLSAAGYSFTGAASVDLGAQTVSVTVANPSLTGFALDLSVPVPGLSIGLSNATVASVTYSPDYTTYTATASLAAGQSYPLSLSATGYSFTGATSVDVGTQTVTATVANPTPSGFAIDFSEPVPGLVVRLTGATVSRVTYSPDYTTYSVAAPLAADTSYPLSLSAPGYAISGGNAVNVPVQAVTATVANPSLTGFTLGFPEPVPGLTVGLSGATVSQITHSSDYTTYAVQAQLAAGTDYPLSLSAAGYTISVSGGSAVDVPVQQVTATVTNQTPTTFDLGLSMPVPNLTIAVAGATVAQVTYAPDFATYSVTTSQLVGGQSYPLVLAATGYSFTAPGSVGVPAQTVAAAVYGATPDAFTLAVPNPPQGFGPASLQLTAGGSPVTIGTPVSSGTGTYSIPVPGGLIFGTTYTLKLVQSGYTFAAPVTFGVTQPLASSSDGYGIMLNFGTAMMATLPAAPAGFSVTLNGAADTVTSVTSATYGGQPSALYLALTNPVATGTVSVSYTPGTIATAGGAAWPAFSGVSATTGGAMAQALAAQNDSDATVTQALATAGYTPQVVAQALVAAFPNETSGQIATLLDSTMAAPVAEVAAGLVLAGFPVDSGTGSVAATLAGAPYHANAVTVATSLAPEASTCTATGCQTSASALIAIEQAAGFTGAADLAQALFASNFTVGQAIGALQSLSLSGFGPALVGAGYDLPDAVAALNNSGGGAAVASAFPTIFTATYTSATPRTVAAYLYQQHVPVLQAATMLNTLYAYPNTAGFGQNDLAALLTGSPAGTAYSISDVAAAVKAWLDDYGQNAGYPPSDFDSLTAVALQLAGDNPVSITETIHSVFGDGGAAMITVFGQMAFNGDSALLQPLTDLQTLQQAGFGIGDVAAAAMTSTFNPYGSVDYATELLLAAGYSAQQVVAAFAPSLGANFNVPYVATMLNYGATVSPQGAYAKPADIATVLQTDLNASPQAAGDELLTLYSGESCILSTVASALQSVYKIDGFDFAQIVAGYNGNNAQSIDLTSSCGLIPLLQHTFDMTDAQVAQALYGMATANGDNALDTLIADIDSAYSVASGVPTLYLMQLAGYGLPEIVHVLTVAEGLTLTTAPYQAMVDLHQAGYSANAVAAYLDNYFASISSASSLDTTATLLVGGGYGGCTSTASSLTGVITALEVTYGAGVVESDTTGLQSDLGCPTGTTGLDDVTAALSAVALPSDQSTLIATVLRQMASSGSLPSAAIYLLQHVFNLTSTGTNPTSASDLATLLDHNGFSLQQYVIPALAQQWGVTTASEALPILYTVFRVPTAPQAVTDLLQDGYGITDIITALNPASPSELEADLQGTTVPVASTVIEMFGLNSPIGKSDPLAVAEQLNTLGFSETDAVPILESLGYTTSAEIGSLLFTDNYGLGYVAAGVLDTLPGSAINGAWWNALFPVLQQMTTCGSPLSALPACTSGSSTFTESDAVTALTDALGGLNPDCTYDAEFCAIVWSSLQSAGLNTSQIISALMGSPFHMDDDQIAQNLLNANHSPAQVITAMLAAPVNATVDQIATSLRDANVDAKTAGAAIESATGADLETASEDLMAGGYSALQIGYWYASQGAGFQDIYHDLRAIGFGYTDAFDAAYTIDPETPQQVMDYVGSNEAA